MNEIKCPYDLNQFILGEPTFESPFPVQECEKRKFYGDCYHCFSTAIASRDHQLQVGLSTEKRGSMNYIDKEKSIKADIASIENRVRHAFNQGYDFGFKDGKEKAKSQKPVLDKIRAEIIDTGAYEQEVNGKTEFLKGIDYCLETIEKYRAESGGNK